MAVTHSVRTDVRYVLTERGREDLLYAPRCQCSQLWVCDGVYQCLECQTIYSVVYGFSMPTRRLNPRVHR
jgi:hypothetical protein